MRCLRRAQPASDPLTPFSPSLRGARRGSVRAFLPVCAEHGEGRSGPFLPLCAERGEGRGEVRSGIIDLRGWRFLTSPPVKNFFSAAAMLALLLSGAAARAEPAAEPSSNGSAPPAP